jgi:hypothetical protein
MSLIELTRPFVIFYDTFGKGQACYMTLYDVSCLFIGVIWCHMPNCHLYDVYDGQIHARFMVSNCR